MVMLQGKKESMNVELITGFCSWEDSKFTWISVVLKSWHYSIQNQTRMQLSSSALNFVHFPYHTLFHILGITCHTSSKAVISLKCSDKFFGSYSMNNFGWTMIRLRWDNRNAWFCPILLDKYFWLCSATSPDDT